MKIDLQLLPHAADLPLPTYASEGAAGMDVCAAVNEPMILAAGKVVMVPTGVCVAIPRGYEMQVRSRSGLAAKQGVFALNSPGTIDSDYRGEVKVILANFSSEDVIIERGSRIAQLVVARHENVQWDVVASLDDTHRGEGGFGSTGR
ncbi:MAG: dUTP diphosphatase [Ignavibacteria bacterium]|nr:dUTP diphosphatase [Ignavibacteria bacterium]MBP6509769.1 dUTP diphosphatase [Candidatus Kapabacteria bacterium]MBK6419833.1 dUTP diphosphatase [Ignavibacteria bacterium]MBK7033282.1 dUTP diphosphatase [Ignavibacteria bacterium]MBK7184424.1 dUTP diphosphatase [Ignavibacteria bacterium]